jgi:hypothetical protein
MPFRINTSITFDGEPTVDEAIAALEKLREEAGGNAKLRVRIKPSFALEGAIPARFNAIQTRD